MPEASFLLPLALMGYGACAGSTCVKCSTQWARCSRMGSSWSALISSAKEPGKLPDTACDQIKQRYFHR